MDVRMPDGTVISGVPDGITQTELLARYQKMSAPSEPGTSAWDSIKRGLQDPVDKLSQLAARGLVATGIEGEYVKKNVDSNISSGLREYETRRGADAGTDWWRLAGNVAGTAPLAAMMPGAAAAGLGVRTLASAASGGALGALQPVDTSSGADFWSETGKQGVTGAVGGAVAAPLAAAVGRVLSPKTSASVKTLMSEGVTPTPGQVLGGAFKSAEEKLSSVPILGAAIRSGQQRATEQFDRAAINRALFSVGERLPDGMIGREAIQHTRDVLRDKYDDVLSRVGQVKPDVQLGQDLQALHGALVNSTSTPKGLPDRFKEVIANEFAGRAKNGSFDGEAIKKAESELTTKASEFMRSTDPDQAEMGRALSEAVDAIRGWLARVAPQDVSSDLKRANAGWANFKRVERAAGYLGADDGVFTAAQLQGAVKALDRSKDKGGFARGDALMQDLADAGKQTLANKAPNSGTTDRALLAALTVGPLAGHAISPLLPLAAIPSAAYLPGVQRGVAGLLASRPEALRALGNRFPALTPSLTAALAPTSYGLLGE